MKRVAISSVLLASLALLGQSGPIGQASDPQKGEKKIQIYCPVVGLPESPVCKCASGGYYCSLKPKERHTAEVKGAKVQFCCADCVSEFKKAPAKFAVAANHQLVATKQAQQEKCPLCGSEVGSVAPVNVAGIDVRFCKNECRAKVADAKPAERASLVFGEKAFARSFVVIAEAKK